MKMLVPKRNGKAFKKAKEVVPASLEVLGASIDNFNFNMEFVDGFGLEEVEEAVDYTIGVAMTHFNKNGAYNKDFHRKAWKFVNSTQILYRKTSPNPVVLTSGELRALQGLVESLYYCYKNKAEFEAYKIEMGELMEFK